MPVSPLSPQQLRHQCHADQFDFETTAELEPAEAIIGQPRGVRAIEFGIGIQSHGYNIFVVGETGTGRTAALEQFLKKEAARQPVPNDWIYVHNFNITHRPRAISLPAGLGRKFQDDMAHIIKSLQKTLPDAFDTEAYREEAESIRRRYKEERNRRIEELRTRASQEEMAIVSSPSGFMVMPMQEGKALTADEYQQLPVETYQELEKLRQKWNEELDEVLHQIRERDEAAGEQVKTLSRDVAQNAITHYFDDLRGQYETHPDIVPYINAFYEDVLDNLPDFFPPDPDDDRDVDLRRYEVNLLVDNGAQNGEPQGAPVVVELNPRFSDLLGRVEYDMQQGGSSTHFTNIKPGSLHRANGGYLIMNVRDILSHRSAWEALKRTIKAGEIKIQPPDRTDGGQVQAKSLDPEPIPLTVKIVLIGTSDYYYTLYNREEDFSQLFKVKAEFDTIMPRDAEHELSYARYIASRCREENLRQFDRTAVAKLVEYGSRLCEHQQWLSTRFGDIADIIREASFWAGREQRGVVTAVDVQRTLDERRDRANLDEEYILRNIQEGTLFIDTTGQVIGQVNGLSVVDIGDYAFGQPGRITARTYKGERGIINIDREVDLTGPIHHKGLLTLTGYLGGQYAQDRPLSISASVTFEQNYSNIEGDSASSAELYVILSSLAALPIRQGVAVTGSVNQRGEIQPIGGVNEKIEGFFAVCQARGLTGDQGVIMPKANLPHLMLSEEVTTAVADNQFHIWAIESIDEGVEILMNLPAGEPDENGEYPENTVHYAVVEGILMLGRDDEDEDDEDDEEEDAGGEETEEASEPASDQTE
ncbi:MAG: AAA family ATPase [Anaerolineales bacterium]|nr:AAA family ATPase [Anaerolineales bacterium]